MDLVLRKKSNYFLRAHAHLKPLHSPTSSSDSLLGKSTGLIEQVIQNLSSSSDNAPNNQSLDGLYSTDGMYEIGRTIGQDSFKSNEDSLLRANSNSISLFHRDSSTPSSSTRGSHPRTSLEPDTRRLSVSSSSSSAPLLPGQGAPKYFTCPSRTTVQMQSNAFCNVEFSFYQTQPTLNLHNRHKPWLFNVGIILELTLYEIVSDGKGVGNVPVIAVAATTRLELNDKHGPESPLMFTMVAPAFDGVDLHPQQQHSAMLASALSGEAGIHTPQTGTRGASLVDAFGIGKLCVSSVVRDPVRHKTTFSMKNASAFVFQQPLAKLLHSPSFELFPFQEPPTFKFVIIPHFLLNLDTPRQCFLSVKPLSALLNNRPSRSCTPTTVFPTNNIQWQDPLYITMDLKQLEAEKHLFFAVIDHTSHLYLMKFALPIQDIRPGEQYDIEYHSKFTTVDSPLRSSTKLIFSLSLLRTRQMEDIFYDKHPQCHKFEIFLLRWIPKSADDPPMASYFTGSAIAVLHFIKQEDYESVLEEMMEGIPLQQNFAGLSHDNLKPGCPKLAKSTFLNNGLYPEWNKAFEFNIMEDKTSKTKLDNWMLLLSFYDLALPRLKESKVTFVGHAVISVAPYLTRPSGKGIPSKEPSHFITAQVHLHGPPRDASGSSTPSSPSAEKDQSSPNPGRPKGRPALVSSDPSKQKDAKTGSFEVVLNLRHWTGKSYAKIINAANNLRVSDSEAFLHHSKVTSGDNMHLPFPLAHFTHDASPSPLLSGLHTHFHSRGASVDNSSTGDNHFALTSSKGAAAGDNPRAPMRSKISHVRSRSHGDSASQDSLSDDFLEKEKERARNEREARERGEAVSHLMQSAGLRHTSSSSSRLRNRNNSGQKLNVSTSTLELPPKFDDTTKGSTRRSPTRLEPPPLFLTSNPALNAANIGTSPAANTHEKNNTNSAYITTNNHATTANPLSINTHNNTNANVSNVTSSASATPTTSMTSPFPSMATPSTTSTTSNSQSNNTNLSNSSSSASGTGSSNPSPTHGLALPSSNPTSPTTHVTPPYPFNAVTAASANNSPFRAKRPAISESGPAGNARANRRSNSDSSQTGTPQQQHGPQSRGRLAGTSSDPSFSSSPNVLIQRPADEEEIINELAVQLKDNQQLFEKVRRLVRGEYATAASTPANSPKTLGPPPALGHPGTPTSQAGLLASQGISPDAPIDYNPFFANQGSLKQIKDIYEQLAILSTQISDISFSEVQYQRSVNDKFDAIHEKILEMTELNYEAPI